MINMKIDSAFLTRNAPVSTTPAYMVFMFLTKEIDFETIDQLAYAKQISSDDLNRGQGSFGQLLTFLGVSAENLYGTYVPTVVCDWTDDDVTQRGLITGLTSASLNTFTSKLDEAPKHCLIFLTTGAGANMIPNNSDATNLLISKIYIETSSLVTASVGLRDSDAEIILLADEFKKGAEYRISDFIFEYDKVSK